MLRMTVYPRNDTPFGDMQVLWGYMHVREGMKDHEEYQSQWSGTMRGGRGEGGD